MVFKLDTEQREGGKESNRESYHHRTMEFKSWCHRRIVHVGV